MPTARARARRACPALRCAVAALGLVMATVPAPVRGQAGGVEVVAYTPDRVVLGGQPYVIVRGILANRGPVVAADIQVTLRLRRGPGGELLAPPGNGLSWLGPLAPGQEGLFSAVVRYCCPEDVGEYELTLGWRGGATAPYRGLVATPQAMRDSPAGPRLFGTVENAGGRAVDASTVRVYAGFWSGAQLVDARAVLVPAVFDDGPGGMALGRGQSLPWSTTVPDRAYDRVEMWAASEPYPEGAYPVPLGASDVRVRPAALGVIVTGRVRNCGTRDVADVYALLVARDEAGAPLQFEGVFLPGVDLPAGGAREVVVPWPGAEPTVLPAAVALEVFALVDQPDPPPESPCRAPVSLFLPAAWRDAASAGRH